MKKKKRVSKRKTEKHHPNLAWFRAALDQRGLSQAEVSRKSGIPTYTLSRTFHGKQRLKLKETAALASAIGVAVDELMAALGIPLSAPEGVRSLSLSGWLDGGAHLVLRPTVEGLRGSKTATCPFPDRDISVARVQSSGTEYDGLDGALVYYRESKARGVDPETVGRIALVSLAGEGAAGGALRLRVIRRGYSSGRYNLTNLAGRVLEESVGVERVYPVVWLKV